ncbi:MAG TPA: uridine phosphorylase [Bacillota bacterium]|jgi:uridine phosphorylase|nr:uridine phosphorylase [Fastidiosipila sp.]HPX93585.1 uridine phosphorylase [Bacillota bacterium]HQB80560.1 uridine phosphorylase [Bacillota bacterium]
MEKLYHIQLDDSHGAQYAILPGDPGRVEKIAGLLDQPRFLGINREYTSWLGSLEDEPVLVMSTGMGGPSTAIGVEELYMTGVRYFVRVGTCGGMSLEVMGGDLVIATGAIRMEGTSREYLPIEFPAVADFELTGCLADAAKAGGYRYHTGVVQCKDSFYGQHSPERMPVSYELENKWQAWLKGGTLASEMESAALYIVCQSLGAKAACILNTIWNQERRALGMDDTESHDTMRGIRVAVEAIRRHIQINRE